MEQELHRTPDWLVERVALEELPEGEEQAGRRLVQEPDGPDRLAALQASNEEILRAYTPVAVVAEVQRRHDQQQSDKRRRLALRLSLSLGGLAAAAALLLLAIPSDKPVVPATEGPEVTRIKGLQPHLLAYRKTAAGEEPLQDNEAVRAGDLIQLSYVARKGGYGMVVSVDGRGAVTTHLPESAGKAAVLDPGGEMALSFAYELDDAPDFERFFLVTSPEQFDTGVVVQAVRQLASPGGQVESDMLDLPEGLSQSSLLLDKVQP